MWMMIVLLRLLSVGSIYACLPSISLLCSYYVLESNLWKCRYSYRSYLYRTLLFFSGYKVKAICETCAVSHNMEPADRKKNMAIVSRFLTQVHLLFKKTVKSTYINITNMNDCRNELEKETSFRTSLNYNKYIIYYLPDLVRVARELVNWINSYPY